MNRVSENPDRRVLVLENGHQDLRFDPLIRMPNAPIPVGSDFYAWHYPSLAEPGLMGRRLVHHLGRIAGGRRCNAAVATAHCGVSTEIRDPPQRDVPYRSG